MSKPKSPWQPIETAPRDGTMVIVSTVGIGLFVCCGASYNDVLGVWCDDFQPSVAEVRWRPTHWMPIPPLPEETP